MKVKIKKLHPDAVIPSYSKPGDAGMDLVSISETWNDDNSMVTYDTGIAMEIPEGFVGLVFPRSSISKTSLNLSNSVGVIDSGYRGEVSFRFKRLAWTSTIYNVGEKIGQLVILPYPQIQLEQAKELSETERGEGGYGSSGN